MGEERLSREGSRAARKRKLEPRFGNCPAGLLFGGERESLQEQSVSIGENLQGLKPRRFYIDCVPAEAVPLLQGGLLQGFPGETRSIGTR